MSDEQFTRRPSRAHLLILVTIFLLGLALRLVSIRTYSPNPDEIHWIARSEKLADRYADGQINRLTNHLGHPGIPAAVLMALTEFVGDSWNSALDIKRGEPRYIDHLSAGRLANVIWYALLIPLVFITLRSCVGDNIALLAAALIAFDCQHIANTRVAHIDGAITTLAFCCIALYVRAQEKRSLYLKSLAGIAWGLCISVKPTAVAIIGIFLVYNLLVRISGARSSENYKTPPSIGWSDLFAAFLGMATLASIYTRLWDPNSRYLRAHKINPYICTVVGDFSDFISAHPLLGVMLAVSTVAALTFSLRRVPQSDTPRKDLLRTFLCPLLFCLLFLLCLAALLPTITCNVIRFWGWVLGLSQVRHVAYGATITPPEGGYLRIWFGRLSPWELFGFIIGAFIIGARCLAADGWRWIYKNRGLVLCLAVPIIWTLPLSISKKEAFRYILPSLPFFLAVAAFGLQNVWSRTLARLNWSETALPALFAVPQLFVAVKICPDFNLYFSPLSGGFAGAVRAGYPVPSTRYEEVFKKLNALGKETHSEQYLEISGDYDLMRSSYLRLFQPGARKVKIIPFHGGFGSDWVLSFPYITDHKVPNFNFLGNMEEVSRFEYEGQAIYKLFKVNTIGHGKDIPIDLVDMVRATGIIDEENNSPILRLNPSESKSGFAASGVFLKVPVGESVLTVTAQLTPPLKDPDQVVFRMNFSNDCTRVISVGDFGPPPENESPKSFDMTCHFDKASRPQLSIFWFNKQGVVIKDLSVSIK